MTIAAAYLTSEGVVLGADSTTTVSGDGGVIQLLNHAQKVYEVGTNSRIGVCTWGCGSVDGVSHRTLVARLGDEIDLEKIRIQDAAESFGSLVSKLYDPQNGILGYALGGWDVDTHTPACAEIIFNQKKEPNITMLRMGEARFFGHPEFFSRVFNGFDNTLPDRLYHELSKKHLGVENELLQKALAEAFFKASQSLAVHGFRDLPVREAIDFVYTYLHVTIKAFKFRAGPPVCGGPIEIGFISSDRKFRWVRHKEFDRAINEQEAW